MLTSKSIILYSLIVDSFLINNFAFLAWIPFDLAILHEGLIEDTSSILKSLGLLYSALGVDDKIGQRPLHLTAYSRVELIVSFL